VVTEPASTEPAVQSADPPLPVLAALPGQTPKPTTAGLTAALAAALRRPGLGARVVFDVTDAATGSSLLGRGADTPVVPASTAKLLTAVAALSVLGPQTQLPTRVVAGADVDEIVLVAGGDALLAAGRGRPDAVIGRAGLADLADATAAALTSAGRAKVTLRLDDTLFTGARTSPAWRPSDLTAGFVAPIAPLAADDGRAVDGHPARTADPALSGARTFAKLLAARGISVPATVSRVSAPTGAAAIAAPIAQVLGAPIGDVVEHMLVESDNTVAEVLGRLVAAHTGAPATFAGAGAAVLETVGDLGVPVAGARLVGGSGLARGGLLAPHTLTATLVLATAPDHPELRPVLSGLPVAGVTGTLADRFTGAGATAAVGVVRAKTGTLTGASSLAGLVVDTDGRLLAFAVLADRVPRTADARDALDAVAGVLARCGCP
jgi:D-alanyl-D-alanine carboxypeptidase/D-alanyl-D-alanine-endopeptidase (penicillin-binding protein 4)